MTDTAIGVTTGAGTARTAGAQQRGMGRPFWRMWSADLASGAGDGIRIGALPLLAASLDYSPGAVAAVWFAGGLPFVLVGPFSGVLADRWRNPRQAMLLCDVFAASAALVFAVLVASGSATIAVLFAFNFLVGAISTLRDNSAMAIVPELVPRHLLDKANSRVEGAQLITIDLLGPPLGALLFALPNGLPFFVDALSFAVAGLLVFGLPRPRPAPAAPRSSSVLADMREGARWLWRHRLLRSVCLLTGLTTLAVISAMSVAVLYAFEVLDVGRMVYVLLLAVIALGAVLGSLAAPLLAARLGRAGALRAAFVLAPAAFVVAGMTSDPVVATLALTTIGATVGICNVITVSLRHVLVPPELMGRVNSSYRLVAVGMGPVGAAMGGLTGELFGLRAPFFVSAVAAGAGLALVLFSVTSHKIEAATQDDRPETPVRRRRLRTKLMAWLAALLLLVPVATAGYLTWTVRRSFPVVDGRVTVAGLAGQAEVIRDSWGVPQIYADNPRDLFLAQGYVHAQDRFWEMDIQRHVTAGRLAELFGEGQVETDKVVRTLGWYRVAQAELTLLSPQTREYLQAYADGVNAYLGQRGGAQLSAEYAVLGVVNTGYEPQPWTPVDSVAWLKAMAWNLRGNSDEEIQRSLLAAKLPPHRVDQLYPPYDFRGQRPITSATSFDGPASDDPAFDGPAFGGPAGDPAPAAVLSQRPGIAEIGDAMRVLDGVLGPSGSGIGSNSWVVTGSRTTSGRPMLANDPHLGPQLPSVWYQVGLHCRTVSSACPYDVSGFGFAGMPAIFIGHNAEISWGLTNLGADVTDLYLERIDERGYEYEGRRLPLATRQEVITVAGGPPITITVESTRHGPIISGVIDDARKAGELGASPGAPASDEAYAVALRWSALEPSATVDSVFAINRAGDWNTFRDALRGFAAPAQNVVYADRAGHIGYQAIGQIPVRTAGDGRYPVPGWTGQYEWTGYVPYDALPRVYDPPSGYIVTANNAAAGPGYPYVITTDWADGHRSERITSLIEQAGPLDAEAMRRIQRDTHSPFAQVLVPHLLQVRPGSAAQGAVRLLPGWDHDQPPDSAAAAYFNAVWRALLRLTITDDLAGTAADPSPDGGGRWLEVFRGLLDRPDDPFWRNDGDPRGLRTRDDVLRAALDDAAAELTQRLGPDPAGWRWGALHRLTLQNQTLGVGGPGPVRRLLNRGPYELGGGSAAVNATGWDARDGYQVDWIPSMRMVVDLSDWDASGWINQAGASGHAFHGNYADQTEMWVRGETTAWPFGRPAVDSAGQHRLTLLPPAQPNH